MAINKRKILDSAQKHLQKGALEKALKDYQTLLKADPKDPNVRLKIGDIQLKRGKTDDAIAAYLKVAESFMQNGFDAKAVALYKQITKIDDKRVDVFVPLAELYERMGLQSDALKALQQAADVHYREGQKDQALDLLRRMAALDPSNTANRIKVADLLRQEDRNEEAIAEYEEVATELERQGAEEDRIRILVRVLELDPNRIDLMASVGRSRIASGNFEAAEKTARMMIEHSGDDPSGYELLGEAFDGMGQVEERVDAYRRAAEIYRERGDDGIARDLTQRFVAPASLEDEIEIDDVADDALLGDADHDLGGLDPEESDPGFDPNSMSIGNPIDDLEDLDEPAPAAAPLPPLPTVAGAAAEDASVDGDPEQLLAEASVYLRYGKHDRAIESLQSIVAQDPTHALAFSKLGEALSASGNADRAAAAFEKGAAAALTGGDPSTFDMIKGHLAAIDPARADALASSPDGEAPPASDPIETDIDIELDGAAEASNVDVDVDVSVEVDSGPASETLDIEMDLVTGDEPEEASVELPDVEISIDEEVLSEPEPSITGAADEAAADVAAGASEIEVEIDGAEPDNEIEFDVDVAADEEPAAAEGIEAPQADFELSDPDASPADVDLGLDADIEFDVGDDMAEASEASTPLQASADPVALEEEISLDDDLIESEDVVAGGGDAESDADDEVLLDDGLLAVDEDAVDSAAVEDSSVAADEISLSEEAPSPIPESADLEASDEESGDDLLGSAEVGFDEAPIPSEEIGTDDALLSEDFQVSDDPEDEQIDAVGADLLAEADSDAVDIVSEVPVEEPVAAEADANLSPLTDELDIAGGAFEEPPIPEAPESASATTPAQVAEDLEEADFFYQQGMLDEAREIYQRILAGAPSHPQVLLRVGEIDAALGRDADEIANEPVQSEAAIETEDVGADLFDDEIEEEGDAAEPVDAAAPVEDEIPEMVLGDELSEEPVEEEDAEADSVTPRRPTLAEADVTGPVVMESLDEAAPEDDDAFDLAAQLSEVFDVEEPAAGSSNLGLGAEDEGFEQVFAAFKQGVEGALEDTDFEAHYDLGIAYREMGLVEDAISEFTAAMGAPERKLPCLHMMGLCALDLTRHADAVAHLEQALALPDVPAEQQMAIRFDLGRAYAAQMDVPRARAAFEAVQELDPDFQEVSSHLSALDDLSAGTVAAGSEEGSEAFENFDDLMAEDPEAEPEAPAEAQYESFDEFMDDDDEDQEEQGADDSEDAEPAEAAASVIADGSEEGFIEAPAELLHDEEPTLAAEEATSLEPEADEVEAESAGEVEPVEAAELEPDPVVTTEDPADESTDGDEPPKKARRKKKISFV